MTLVVAALMIVASAAIIARPLLRPLLPSEGPSDQAGELLEREKSVALLAIREADFDHAMGKLSDEDHASLKRIYEQRALDAMNALAKTAGQAAGSVARPAEFCVHCGAGFAKADKFCTSCGTGRPELSRPA